jgi:cytochrome P450 family 6
MANNPTFFLYELAINEEIQDKARDEVFKTLAKHGGKLSYEAVSEIKYLDQCLNETLRKYPPSNLSRETAKDYQIPNTKLYIPKGTTVNIPVYAIHYDENNYPEPEKFDPDRFTQDEINKRHPTSYLPFGEGPRFCIGKRFAMFVMKLGLIKFLMNYKFTIDRSKTTVPLIISSKKSPITFVPPDVYLNLTKIEEKNF